MRVALVIEDDYATRRVIAQALLAEGYGVCESHAPDPIPFTPSLESPSDRFEFRREVLLTCSERGCETRTG